ncbi:MAG: cytochrome c [Candidatus Rokubacteria bacterium]|nr:cytochrome c [Candidatus Rokubacteria bacterium]
MNGSTVVVYVVAATFALAGTGRVDAQMRMPHSPAGPSSPSSGTSGEHGAHGTPSGWKFSWPAGNPAKGRDAFVKLECASCHEVKGEKFAAPTDPGKVGPELSQMSPLHDAEYFAEALINPSAVIEPGKGYAAPDGSSKMPSFNDSVTVQEVVDLVAFLKSLKPPAGHSSGGSRH